VRESEWKSLFILAKLDDSAGPFFDPKAAASFYMAAVVKYHTVEHAQP
jgi:hypothetical protein